MIFNHIPTKDAKTLGGHAPSYFAPLESIGYFEKTVLIGTSTTKIESLKQGVYRFSSANTSITDLPSGASTSTSNVHFLIVMENGTQKTYILTEPQSGKVWFGKTYGSGITWKEVASLSDLANYLPLDGGGRVKRNSASPLELESTSATSSWLSIYSTLGYLGRLGFSAKETPAMMTTGGGVKELLHTGNMADHVLLLTGGTVKNAANDPLAVEDTADNICLIKYRGVDGVLGYIGFNRADNPVVYSSGLGTQELHHSGNSVKVVISETAPSDTSALWVY